MDLMISQEANELFEAQSLLYRHVLNFIDSMSLKCAVELGILDMIHSHNQPITLPELVNALQIHPSRSSCVHRPMRGLVHCGFFATTKVSANEEEEGYVLTPTSKLMLKDGVANFTPLVQAFLDPVVVTPWDFLGNWFQGNDPTAFDRTHGMGLWEYCSKNPELGRLGNEAMASDSKLKTLVAIDSKPIFEGVDSLVDVGGGNGTFVRIVSEAFPQLKCTLFS